MATPNVGILTNAGKNLIDRVNAGQTKIAFTKIVFSSMDNSQLTDDKIRALTTVAPQEVVVNNPEVTLDNNTGETRIRATGTNEKLDDGVYVKTYGVFAKDDTGNEILYGLTVSPNPNYLPEYDGVTPQAVTYSYKVNISNTSNITFTNSNDVYVSDTDLDEALQPYAKTVDVNQQLDKKVNTADMRKAANDVAGIEEVNAKQDKIGYTPADDSKVVHDNHDNTVKANNVNYDLSKTGLTPLSMYKSGSFNDLPLGTVFADATRMTDSPNSNKWFTTTTFFYSEWTNRKAQIAIADSVNLMYFRVMSSSFWNSWTLLSDDSKVAHLSGANNFDTVPTVNNNPLLLASSLPPDIARTGQSQTFTAAQTFSIAPTIKDASQDKGDNQAATMADLKSVEESAWRQLDVPSNIFSDYEGIYKINSDEKYLEICASGRATNYGSSATLFDLSSIINKIVSADMILLSDGEAGDGIDHSGAILTGVGTSGFSCVSGDMANGFARVYYDKLLI